MALHLLVDILVVAMVMGLTLVVEVLHHLAVVLAVEATALLVELEAAEAAVNGSHSVLEAAIIARVEITEKLHFITRRK